MPLRILHIVKKLPYPLKDGEAVANDSLSRALKSAGCHIDLLAMNTAKHYVDHQSAKSHLDQYLKIEIVDIRTEPSIIGVLKSQWRGSAYHVDRFDHAPVREALIMMLKQSDYDIIQLESLYTLPYIDAIRAHSAAKVVMRAHNVEHQIWSRLASGEQYMGRRWALGYLSRQLEQYEREAIQAVDLITTVSSIDQSLLQQWSGEVPVQSYSIGLDMSQYKVQPSEKRDVFSIGFIGSMDWRPNAEGVDWFLAEVWPQIMDRHHNAAFKIAGRNISVDQIKRYAAFTGVEVVGEVDDAHEFMRRCDVLITPLFSGSGMRVKIIEAMALATPVVSTSIGLEGIAAVHLQHIMVADTAVAFSSSIDELIDQPALRAEIGRESRRYVEENFDINQLTRKLLSEYRNL